MKIAERPAQAVRILCCRVGDHVFGLEMAAVAGVRESGRLRRGSPAEWRGPDGPAAIPHLGELLGLPGSRDASKEHVVVLRNTGGLRPILVGSVSRMMAIRADRIHPVPSLLLGPTDGWPFEGVVDLSQDQAADDLAVDSEGALGPIGKLAMLLDPDRLLAGHSTVSRSSPTPSSQGVVPIETSTDPSDVDRRRVMILPLVPPQGEGRPIACALSASQVLEILEPPTIVAVPLAPPDVTGLIAWRGRVVPVIDLARRLGLAAFQADRKARLLIARGEGDGLLAFLVHPGIQAMRLPLPTTGCPPTTGLDRRLVRGLFQWDDATLVVPDIQAILNGQTGDWPAHRLLVQKS